MIRLLGSWAIAVVSIGVFVVAPIADATTDPTAWLGFGAATTSFVLVGLLIGAYAGIVIVTGGPLAGAAGGQTISVALSTLLVAALFQPLRRRVPVIVDRWFDRARINAERTTAAFNRRLRDEVDIATVTSDLRETVSAAVRPVHLGVWLREADR